MRTKTISIVALLLMAVTGTWAQTPVKIKSTGVVRSTTAITKEAAMQNSENVRVAKNVTNPKAAPKMAAGPRKAPAPGYASVTLAAGDVWGDGSGYQMLLDADATAYGTIIPETGPLTSSGDASAETYAEFEYKIPANADGAMTTSNIVFNNSITIEIPAGTYDWCITNPTPGARIWIASGSGNVGGRQDDFEFKSEGTYVFTVSSEGSGDQVNLEATFPCIPTLPTELTATPDVTSAEVSWTPGENNDAWSLRYRECVDPIETNRLIDLPIDSYKEQLEDILIFDADGDGNNWWLAYTSDAQDDVCFASESWKSDTYEALTPDNWLMFPAKLGGTFKFKVKSQMSSYPDTFGVFVVDHQDFTSVDEFVQVGNDLDSGEEDWHEVEFDLSAFNGIGYVAIRHYNCTDQFIIYVDDIEITVPDPKMPNEWIVLDDVTNPYTITGLSPETDYEVQVMAYNDNDETDWSKSNFFTTLPAIKTLDEVEDNTDWLAENDGQEYDITLTRTLLTGSYNTFAVPFAISSEKLTELGITAKELTTSAFETEKGVLTLNFADATEIEAGKPYLVKVSSNVENPTFEGVTVSSQTVPTETEATDFIPTLGKVTIDGNAKSILYVGAGNVLYNPTELPGDMKGFRAYFQLKGDAASEVRAFSLDFGDDDATGIISLTADGASKANAATYTLDGRRIESQPAQKGVYIVNGKKTVIK